jgi:ABC-type dipeptide/oligopeptide/nickel transport system ATPase subunit
MNRGRNTTILAALAAALVAYLYFVERHREAPPAETPGGAVGKVFSNVDGTKVEELRIVASSGERTTLRKADGTWRLVEPIDAPADQNEATNAASNLASADVQRVVDEQPKDLAAFGLAKPRVTIAFRAAGDKAPRTLLLGDKNPTGSDVYAKLPDAPRVFLVSAYLEGTFDKGVFGFRDKRVLTFDREKVDRLLESVGASHYADRRVGLLSGGEQQRLRVGQALADEPTLLLCDEPLSNLDLANQVAVTDIIDRQRRERGAAVLFVTHDINPILGRVDRILYIAGGRFVLGTPEEVLQTRVLTALYGTPVFVLRAGDRLVVVGVPDAEPHHDHAHDHGGAA